MDVTHTMSDPRGMKDPLALRTDHYERSQA